MAENKEESLNKKQDQPKEQSTAQPKDQAKNDHEKKVAADHSSKSAEDVTKLKQTVVQLQKKLDDMENRYLRAEADMKNIQNHAKKEQADLIKYDGQQLAHDILPIVDNLQRALAVEVTDDNGKQLKKGVSMVYEHLNKALKDNGVEVVDALNKPFDPKFEQAIQTADADEDHPAETVVQVLQDGYRLKDRVLRPAMVVVAK
ncbi:nucleotide exchange factor GrpE [Lentilactobacillus sp. IMAU92037]|uniref:nucleotide exchange factor GrpE n=1 Tax=Lentilactobacillus TaxID=2767893 RepID=UPI001C2656B3|nr:MULTISPECIES: nucleotide exchange factor GrpE [Lentilactobacillus]MBU9788029.1 nucleotide exchange factor GrpE [Lentilactobacillus dabitei]MBV0929151.1 nucleotide exchange factor GrpE [Lentilactobacillus dabitei]MDM7515297.1 nucleotide exchange factor GrpE [Lentilactobacillus sp. TOM.63]